MMSRGKKLLSFGDYIVVFERRDIALISLHERYNGRATDPPTVFPPEMEEACQIIEKVVNRTISKRPRYPLEWGGTGTEGHAWKANVAASNCYTGRSW
jgi:hypothetical protein